MEKERKRGRKNILKLFIIGFAIITIVLLSFNLISALPCSGSGPCNDNNICTSNDKCINGVCVGTPIICNDNNACTTDSCNPRTGACDYIPIICNDNNACTTDTCNSLTGCVYTPIPDCGGGCTSTCTSSQLNKKRCNGNSLQTCVLSNGCYVWDDENCPYGCDPSSLKCKECNANDIDKPWLSSQCLYKALKKCDPTNTKIRTENWYCDTYNGGVCKKGATFSDEPCPTSTPFCDSYGPKCVECIENKNCASKKPPYCEGNNLVTPTSMKCYLYSCVENEKTSKLCNDINTNTPFCVVSNGAAKCAQCRLNTPADCSSLADDCNTASCNSDNVCYKTPIPAEPITYCTLPSSLFSSLMTPVNAVLGFFGVQSATAAKTGVCDGEGNCKQTCPHETCYNEAIQDGKCGYTPIGKGLTDDGYCDDNNPKPNQPMMCNGNGKCVQCLTSDDCPGECIGNGEFCNADGMCEANTCEPKPDDLSATFEGDLESSCSTSCHNRNQGTIQYQTVDISQYI